MHAGRPFASCTFYPRLFNAVAVLNHLRHNWPFEILAWKHFCQPRALVIVTWWDVSVRWSLSWMVLSNRNVSSERLFHHFVDHGRFLIVVCVLCWSILKFELGKDFVPTDHFNFILEPRLDPNSVLSLLILGTLQLIDFKEFVVVTLGPIAPLIVQVLVNNHYAIITLVFHIDREHFFGRVDHLVRRLFFGLYVQRCCYSWLRFKSASLLSWLQFVLETNLVFLFSWFAQNVFLLAFIFLSVLLTFD